MKNQNQNEKFNIDISLSDEFYRIYKDQANAINYVRNHRNHRCYKCKEYGHIANECGKICQYCKKFHPTTTCLGRLISLLSRILKKMDNSYSKNLVFLDKLIKRNYEDLEWVLSKKNFENLSIQTQELSIKPTMIYDEDAVKTLQKSGFKNQILKDKINKCNDEDDNEIENFYLFNKFNNKYGFNYKISVSEDKDNKFYSINKINNYYEVDYLNIKEIELIDNNDNSKEIKDIEKFKFVQKDNEFYKSIFKNQFDIKYLENSFDSIKVQIDEVQRINKIIEENVKNSKNIVIGDQIPNNNERIAKNLFKIEELYNDIFNLNKEKIKNSRNKLVINRLNYRINILYDLIDKLIFNKQQYIINKSGNVEELYKYCESKNIYIIVVSKIFKTEPLLSIRNNFKIMQPFLNQKLEEYSSIYKDIKEIKDEKKILKKLIKRNLNLERSSIKKKEEFEEILGKFNSLKEKYDNKNKCMYEKYKNNVEIVKNKFLKIKNSLRNKIHGLVERKQNLYNSIGNMIDKSKKVHSHIQQLRNDQINLLKENSRINNYNNNNINVQENHIQDNGYNNFARNNNNQNNMRNCVKMNDNLGIKLNRYNDEGINNSDYEEDF